MNWNKKIDLINVLVIAVMVLSGSAFMFYYNQQIVNECTSNPLVFGAKKLEKDFAVRFIGTGYFLSKDGRIINNRLTFNSENATIQ